MAICLSPSGSIVTSLCLASGRSALCIVRAGEIDFKGVVRSRSLGVIVGPAAGRIGWFVEDGSVCNGEMNVCGFNPVRIQPADN